MAAPRGAAVAHRGVGRRAGRLLVLLAGRTAAGRGPAGRRCPRCPPGEVVVADSTTVNLYKLAAAALDEASRRRTLPAASSSPTSTTSRPTATSSSSARAGGSSCAGSRRPGRRSDGRRSPRRSGPTWRCSASAMSPTAAAPGWTWPPSTGSPPSRGAGAVGSGALGRGRAGRADRDRLRARGRLHLQVPQRRARGTGVPVRAAGAAGRSAIPDLGLVRPAGPVRDGRRLPAGRRHRPRFTAGTPPVPGPRPRRGLPARRRRRVDGSPRRGRR